MKKYIGIMLSILMIVIVCSACSTNNNQDTSENSYITMAKEFIDAGDYDSALKILEKGYKETGDAAIAVMMAELTVDEETVASTVPEESGSVTVVENPLEAYRGIWAEDGICAEYGGMIMAVYPIEDSECRLELQLTQGIPMSRIANVVLEFETKDLEENCIELHFTDDGWGSEGDIVVTFDDGFIDCEIYNTKYNGEGSFADWGLAEGLYELVRNENAFECLTYESNESATDTEDVIYDTTKASGILAEAGLSEQEYREICVPLTDSHSLGSYNISASPEVGRFDRYHLAYGVQYYEENPDDPDLADAIARWEAICKDYENGGDTYTSNYGYGMYSEYHKYTKYRSLDVYLNDTVYAPKGEDILTENTEWLFESMKEYPNEYVGKPYVLIGYDISESDGNLYVDKSYQNTVVGMQDLRDDVHNPNIISENDYYFYVIFHGTFSDNNGEIGLIFSLLSLEKCN